MQRDLRRLADTKFDVVVVGAGFYGVTTAWDAAQRGLSVAIIDKDDFGAATSFNNLKTLHGGLRSLQAFNLPQMRLFIRERRALARILPHLVRPLPFVVPTTRRMFCRYDTRGVYGGESLIRATRKPILGPRWVGSALPRMADRQRGAKSW